MKKLLILFMCLALYGCDFLSTASNTDDNNDDVEYVSYTQQEIDASLPDYYTMDVMLHTGISVAGTAIDETTFVRLVVTPQGFGMEYSIDGTFDQLTEVHYCNNFTCDRYIYNRVWNGEFEYVWEYDTTYEKTTIDCITYSSYNILAPIMYFVVNWEYEDVIASEQTFAGRIGEKYGFEHKLEDQNLLTVDFFIDKEYHMTLFLTMTINAAGVDELTEYEVIYFDNTGILPDAID